MRSERASWNIGAGGGRGFSEGCGSDIGSDDCDCDVADVVMLCPGQTCAWALCMRLVLLVRGVVWRAVCSRHAIQYAERASLITSRKDRSYSLYENV